MWMRIQLFSHTRLCVKCVCWHSSAKVFPNRATSAFQTKRKTKKKLKLFFARLFVSMMTTRTNVCQNRPLVILLHFRNLHCFFFSHFACTRLVNSSDNPKCNVYSSFHILSYVWIQKKACDCVRLSFAVFFSFLFLPIFFFTFVRRSKGLCCCFRNDFP